MKNLTIVLLGGSQGLDGLYSFSREVLFKSAGEWVLERLPMEKADKSLYLCESATPELSGIERVESDLDTMEGLLQFAKEADSSHIMVVGAPAPQMTREQYEALLEPVHCFNSATQIVGSSIGGKYPTKTVLFQTEELIKTLSDSEILDFDDLLENMNVRTSSVESDEIFETDTPMGTYLAGKKLGMDINLSHIAKGVIVFAPESTYIAPDAVIGAGTQILPQTMIKCGCVVGSGCVIGPCTILENANVGDKTSINNSQMYKSSIGKNATVGPFAYIRPDCNIGDNARIGDFVELKKSNIGNGTKVSHLTYIGDAEVGERVNFGCGTVVVNYDGYNKTKTIIGDDCFIGCNTNLISPVALGDRVFTAAGSTVTVDVQDGALAVARAKQKNIDGWNDKRREKFGKK